jgi:hypothetical protein
MNRSNIALSGIGTHSITAIFGGDVNFTTSTSPAVSQVVEDFSLNISTTAGSVTSQTVIPGAAATYSFTMSMTNGSNFPAAVALTVSSAPAGPVVTISPSTLAAGVHAFKSVFPGSAGNLVHSSGPPMSAKGRLRRQRIQTRLIWG